MRHAATHRSGFICAEAVYGADTDAATESVHVAIENSDVMTYVFSQFKKMAEHY